MASFELKAVLTAANKISPELKKIMQDVAKVSQKFAGMGAGLGNMAKATLPFAALGGVAAFAGKSMLDTTAQFEKFSLVLETLEGSQAKAKSSMSWISDFAAKTPYELAGVTDAFVKLKSYGIDPIQGQTLRVLGDTAAAMGKDLNQSVEALADAVTGENERLKEFGITAKKTGKDILYSYTDKNGKQRLANAKADSREQIRLTLMAIWNEKYGGSMDKLSGSWSGMMSNLMDQMARFSNMVMQSGAFTWLKNQLGGVLDQLNLMGEKPKAIFGTFSSGVADTRSELEKLAETVGAEILKNLKEFWVIAKQVVGVVVQVKDAVGGWGNLFKLTAAIMAGPLVLATIQTVMAIGSLGIAVLKFVRVAAILGRALAMLRVAAMAFMIFTAANPIVLAVVVAVGLLAGAAYLIYKNWAPIKTWFIGFWGEVKREAEVVWGWLKTAFSWTPLGAVIANWSPIQSWLSELWAGIGVLLGSAFDVLKSLFLNFTPLGLIMKNWDPILSYFKGLMDKIRPLIEPITKAFDWKNGPTMGDVQINGGGNGYGAMQPDSGPPTSGGGGQYGGARSPLSTANRPNLLGNNQSRVNGEINVRFDNAPQGMRVETPAAKQGGLAINPDVGYRSAYLGG